MRKDKGNARAYTLIIVLLAAILMAVSNPGEEKHLDAVKSELAGQNMLSGALARTFLAVDPPSYHSAVIFSYTKRDNKLFTVGILGYVWVDIKEKK